MMQLKQERSCQAHRSTNPEFSELRFHLSKLVASPYSGDQFPQQHFPAALCEDRFFRVLSVLQVRLPDA